MLQFKNIYSNVYSLICIIKYSLRYFGSFKKLKINPVQVGSKSTERFKFHVKEVYIYLITYNLFCQCNRHYNTFKHQYTVSCALFCSCIALGLISTSFTAFHRVCARAVA